jgi:hypothetical protein
MIADYFRELTKANRNTIKARLPENMPLWGKFRMARGGDSVRCIMATSKKRSERNMSFVRVSITTVEMYDRCLTTSQSQFELIVFDNPKVLYGRVEKIMECQLPDDPVFGIFKGKLRLLAHITPCKTDGKDATQELTTYHIETAGIVTDLSTIRAVVGRVQTTGGGPGTQKHWGIIDRSSALARATFEEDEESSDDDDE